jgi:hypothetical protein
VDRRVQWCRRFGEERALHETAHHVLMACPGNAQLTLVQQFRDSDAGRSSRTISA